MEHAYERVVLALGGRVRDAELYHQGRRTVHRDAKLLAELIGDGPSQDLLHVDDGLERR
eukprot:CAMPEP_0174739356 /NCGR_PEP_ID=MMETSP1094-20130205/71447_1 /TAXON_ID=156173 /ORGANISM="Chrysochromulina brevifilum, Strain UTEX LB 985" /LENGTH=58 /DNA_ID=CAMNT_0015942909 /DNA_START=60 /DNA_END=233 /DNA_ORIENTATION=+